MEWHSRVPRALMLTSMLLSLSSLTAAKSVDDVVVLKNGDHMTGEIKSLDHGELKFKSSYMLDSVSLNWESVSRLESKDNYLILLASGRVFTARIKLDATAGQSERSFLMNAGNEEIGVSRREVISIRLAEQHFWTQLNGTIDYGFSYTSGNSQYQTQLSVSTVYNGEGYRVTNNMSSVFSGQSEGSSTRRNTYDGQYWKRFRNKWFYGALLDVLSSDQQSLNLRTALAGGVGRTLIQTSRTSFNAFSGIAVARERYSSDQPQSKATTAEALMGLDF